MSRPVVKNGDTILIDYTIRLQNGTLVGTTIDNEPVQCTIGDGELLTGLEQAIPGMHEGDSRTVELLPEAAYGERLDELVQEIDRNTLPNHHKLSVGQTIEFQEHQNESVTARIISITPDKIQIDCNHVLAGKALSIEFKIIEIL